MQGGVEMIQLKGKIKFSKLVYQSKIYPNKLKNRDFGFEKTQGLDDRKLPYIV